MSAALRRRPKRRRPAAQRVLGKQENAEAATLLSAELRAALGADDGSNCLIAPPRKERGAKRTAPPRSDRKKERFERKKVQNDVLRHAVEELKRHALSPENFRKLSEEIQKRQKRKRSTTWPEASTSDEETTEQPLKIDEASTIHSAARNDVTAGPASAEADVTQSVTLLEKTPSPSVAKDARVPPKKSRRPRVVGVERPESIAATRQALPILGYEQEIMEMISDNDVVVICGQTGCGKTTQVPQFLYEAGYGCRSFPERRGRIGVTQPRRIATTSTAARVAAELAAPLGSLVGFQIRHSHKMCDATAIKFMTDGILIRELQHDFLLSSYSALIVDEAHERSLNTDLILGMLSRIVKLRRRVTPDAPLKVVIMSATLESGTFLSNPRLFSRPPPVVEIPSRQFSVTLHFSKRTEMEDYADVALRKVYRIHRQLPPGGILVFLTGKREIDKFCSKLQTLVNDSDTRSSLDVDDYSSGEEEETEMLVGNTADPELPEEKGLKGARILPLYAMLPPHLQSRVFEPLPEGHRLIVVATNVAETSITIPGIRYVVDAGRAKRKFLHAGSGVSNFLVDWISKASATQRAGRAGRTLPGHCYRLYSSAHFGQKFESFEPPEISCISLEEVVLSMKAMGIERVNQFPFPSQPDVTALKSAEAALVAIGALNAEAKVTAVGKQLMDFPIGPRHARMILRAQELEKTEVCKGLTLFAIALAAAMSLESPFLRESTSAERSARRKAHEILSHSMSDPVSSLIAFCHFRQASDPETFCQKAFLHGKIMKEMTALEKQLKQIYVRAFSLQRLDLTPTVPSQQVLDLLRRCILAGWADHLARQCPEAGPVRRARQMPYLSQLSGEEHVNLYPLSAAAKTAPPFLCYMAAVRTGEKVYLHQVTKIEPEWIFEEAQPLCTVHWPQLLSPGPYYDPPSDAVYAWHDVTYGQHHWKLPLQRIPTNDPNLCSRYFALGLLKGQVLPEVPTLNHAALVMPPVFVASAEAWFHKNLSPLLHRLEEQNIRSHSDLLQRDGHVLLAELKPWIKPLDWPEVKAQWQFCFAATSFKQ